MYLCLAYRWLVVYMPVPLLILRMRPQSWPSSISDDLRWAPPCPPVSVTRKQAWPDTNCCQENVRPRDKRQVYTIPFLLTFLLIEKLSLNSYLSIVCSLLSVSSRNPVNLSFLWLHRQFFCFDIILWFGYIVLCIMFCISFMHATNLNWHDCLYVVD